MELEELQALYKKTFGKAPHHKTGEAKILEKLQEAGVDVSPKLPPKEEPPKPPPAPPSANQAQVTRPAVAAAQSNNMHTVFAMNSRGIMIQQTWTTKVVEQYIKMAKANPRRYKIEFPENSVFANRAIDEKCTNC